MISEKEVRFKTSAAATSDFAGASGPPLVWDWTNGNLYAIREDGTIVSIVLPNSFTIEQTTDSTINGANPLLAMYADSTADLKLWLAQVTGGTRVYLWPAATAVPNIPHTGIPPTLAVQGDILVGDIVALESNPMTYFIRANTGLAVSATTTFFCARALNNDTDGGAGIVLTPLLNAGGAVNDGLLRLAAYGKGTGANANSVFLSNRSGVDTLTDRWQMVSAGHIAPLASNTYTLGTSALAVKEIYLAAGTGAGIGKPGRWINVQAASGTGSPGDTNRNTLKSYNVLANTLAANGDTLHFVALFRCAANATTKRIEADFGATTIIDSTAIAHNGQTIVVEGWIMRTGATAQTAYVEAKETTNNPAWSTAVTGGVAMTAPGETLSGAVTLKFTVTLGVGAALNDVIQDALYVENIPA